MKKKTFLSCRCGILMGCRNHVKNELLCEVDCDFNQRIECSISFDEEVEEAEKSKTPPKTEIVTEECDFCSFDDVSFIEDKGAPAFLSEAAC